MTAATQVFEVNDKKASFFYFAYTKDDADPATRPILFCFNGTPGSSTVWLHLGIFGPKRMEFDEDGLKMGMQGKLVENEHSILDMARCGVCRRGGHGLQHHGQEGGREGLPSLQARRASMINPAVALRTE